MHQSAVFAFLVLRCHGRNQSENATCGREFFWNGEKKTLRFQTKAESCGRGLIVVKVFEKSTLEHYFTNVLILYKLRNLHFARVIIYPSLSV